MEPKPKNTYIIQFVIFAVVFAIAFFGTKYFLSGKIK